MKTMPAAMVPAALLCMLVAGCKGSTTSTSAPGTTAPATTAAAATTAGTAAPATSAPAATAAGVSSPASPVAGSATAVTAAAAHGAGKSHPCSLVTSAEAQSALGVAATIDYSNVDDGIYTNCEYISADRMHRLTIQIFDDSVDKSDFAKTPDGATPVAGVADGAYWYPDQQLLGVRQNNVQVNFQLNDNTDTMTVAQIEAALITVAKTAMTRL